VIASVVGPAPGAGGGSSARPRGLTRSGRLESHALEVPVVALSEPGGANRTSRRTRTVLSLPLVVHTIGLLDPRRSRGGF